MFGGMDRVRQRRTSGWIWGGAIGLAALGVAAFLAGDEIRRAATRIVGVEAQRAPVAPRPPHLPRPSAPRSRADASSWC